MEAVAVTTDTWALTREWACLGHNGMMYVCVFTFVGSGLATTFHRQFVGYRVCHHNVSQ